MKFNGIKYWVPNEERFFFSVLIYTTTINAKWYKTYSLHESNIDLFLLTKSFGHLIHDSGAVKDSDCILNFNDFKNYIYDIN